jgi:2-polyprenyl-6-methoxyphenol hydroxylase-like FAD-dependent oxidoreductase
MQVPILIVGAGPTGLASSILLSRFGVRSLVVERHPSTSIHPKATGISTRTMELFRSWGIERRVRDLAMPVDFSSSVRPSLSGLELEHRSLGFPTREEAAAFSPVWPAALAQDLLEPVLLELALSYSGAEVRFSTELIDLEQDETGVRATIVDRTTGTHTEVQAQYLIAADGAYSPIRRKLAIGATGVERIGEYLSILFRADLDEIVGEQRFGLYMLTALGGPAPSVFLPTSNDGRWLLATPWRGDVRPLETVEQGELVELVRRAVGRPDLRVDVVDRGLVGIGAEVADRFREGRVFLVGDAAHRTAPTGGTGMNTAIQSAHNLAWKLAAVMSGIAGENLLDTYEPERRPSGERNLLRSRGQLQGASGVAADLGVVYSSEAIVYDGDDRPAVIEPTAAPYVGSRAPHVWLEAKRGRLSTLDLFGSRLTLLIGAGGASWRAAALDLSADSNVPLNVVTIDGADLRDPSGRWQDCYGIDRDGAVLVRPDGHIAWRSVGAAADSAATLAQVISRVLARPIERASAPAATGPTDPSQRCA